MTTSTGPAPERTDVARGGSGCAAFGLVLLELLAVCGVALVWLGESFRLDTSRDEPEVRLDGYLGALAVVFLVALVVALLAGWRGARAVVWSQLVMMALLLAVIVAGGAAQRHEDERDHPAPGFTGMVGCRSGGDDGECAHTGG
ncbi:DUF6234 family protein [Streptomyces sp. NPDC093093]|uniref:DUF6234 family protein n=1 Tax=Streptomyces sp. NPDC093093 TaxID=3366025 RepID=UPI0037FEF3F6